MDALYLTLYYLFRGFTKLPESLRFPILRGISSLVYRLDAKHRHVARVNLDLAYGDTMSDDEKERIIRKSYENLVFNLADFIASQGITKKELARKVHIENPQIVEEAKRSGRPVVFITAHYGNWELLPYVSSALLGLPTTVVGRPLDSKAMNDLLEKNRRQFDVEVTTKKGAVKGLIKALRQDRAVGVLIDQNTAEKDGVLIDFFGKKARQTPIAALLAKRLDALVIPVFVTSEDHKLFTIHIHPPIPYERRNDVEEEIVANVQNQAHAIEEAIREKPDEWFWLHQRWKNQYQALYDRKGFRS